ncbi:hypothetical protein AJ78_08024 [Emergomyces pasteurianus Ep9510]|uniref:Uncharacterized protein n=1 Tax=Emergomyces pasteurianus Ep9510 TaxID=1447872 RepID=A0A1J9Q7K0_9EURO|nr:hypothetical protein AJ78_08024 [Emergomyces pasteurianus Ep9510]
MEVVQLLLDAGADVNAPLPVGRNRSALSAAASAGYLDFVKLLIKHGARINVPLPVNQMSPLEAAASAGWHHIVDFLTDSWAEAEEEVGGGNDVFFRAYFGRKAGFDRLESD